MINILGLYIQFSDEYLLTQGGFSIVWFLLKNGLWVIFIPIFISGFWEVWMNWRQGKFAAQQKYTLLAINVPKDNIQSPKAVENIFAQFAGAHVNFNRWERYVLGKLDEKFSMEIISIGGYIQFLVRCNIYMRDMVEAAIYAQYPTAEITEVADYVDKVPHNYPNDEYDLWGTEIYMYNNEAYPIRTYPEFEHTMSQEIKDPMAALLEIMSKINPGEQIWLQFIVSVTDEKWKNKAMSVVKKLIGAKEEKKKNWLVKTLDEPIKFWSEAKKQVLSGAGNGDSSASLDTQFGKMFSMSPGERRAVEMIERKISKIGFKTKIRLIYVARKEVFAKGRGVSPTFGALKQFNTLDLNGFKPYNRSKTAIDHFFKGIRLPMRQRKIISAYSYRSAWSGSGTGKIMNTEELASVWHFPMITVKAPLIQKTTSKRSEPPFTLPTGEMPREEEYQEIVRQRKENDKVNKEEKEAIAEPEFEEEPKPSELAQPEPSGKYQPPPNLPVV